ncbi:serine/threonine protein kinase psk1, partial [Physocladia obscura]
MKAKDAPTHVHLPTTTRAAIPRISSPALNDTTVTAVAVGTLGFSTRLLAKDIPPPASPKSSLSSLFAKSASSSGLSAGTLPIAINSNTQLPIVATTNSDFPTSMDDMLDAVTPGGSVADPTLSFKIKNYAAPDLDGAAGAATTGGVANTAATAANVSSGLQSSGGSEGGNNRNYGGKRKADVDDFEKLRVIGQGGYGKVFLVRQKATSKIYAMKVLKKATLVIHTKTVEHTKNERTILSQLAHPFIVKLHYAFQSPERLYLILQYAPGGELFSHLANQRMFDEDTAAFYIGELVLAIEHLHSLGIIYRDLKPENVLLDSIGHILLTDFGLSKVALGGVTRTLCGTVEFTAPEVLAGTEDYGPGVDHWSLGVMLFDMLTGSPPFPGNNRKKVVDAIMSKKVVFPQYVTSFARDLITKLLKKKAAQRIGYVRDDDDVVAIVAGAGGRGGSGGGGKAGNSGGAAEIKAHGFFRKLDWKRLEARKIPPPITPDVDGELDTRNFDDYFTGMALESPPLRGGMLLSPLNPNAVTTAATTTTVPTTPSTTAANTNISASKSTTAAATIADSIVAESLSFNIVTTPSLTGKKKYKAKKKAEKEAAAAAALTALPVTSAISNNKNNNNSRSNSPSARIAGNNNNSNNINDDNGGIGSPLPVLKSIDSEVSLQLNDLQLLLVPSSIPIPIGKGPAKTAERMIGGGGGGGGGEGVDSASESGGSLGAATGAGAGHDFYGFSYVADDGFLD